MLRVEFHDAVNTLIMRLEGRFVGAFAEDAKALMTHTRPPFRLVVDLSDLTYIDAVGEEILSWMAERGAKFVAESSYARDVCERLHLPLSRRRAAARLDRLANAETPAD